VQVTHARYGLAVLALCVGCGGGDGPSPAPAAPSAPVEMVTETLAGDLTRRLAYHSFSMSQAGPVTISITAFSTEWPDWDHLNVGLCSELEPPHILVADRCVPLDWSLPQDLDGQPTGGLAFFPQDSELPVSRTWRLPPSETYALVVTNHVNYHGPEYTYEIVLTHPR